MCFEFIMIRYCIKLNNTFRIPHSVDKRTGSHIGLDNLRKGKALSKSRFFLIFSYLNLKV